MKSLKVCGVQLEYMYRKCVVGIAGTQGLMALALASVILLSPSCLRKSSSDDVVVPVQDTSDGSDQKTQDGTSEIQQDLVLSDEIQGNDMPADLPVDSDQAVLPDLKTDLNELPDWETDLNELPDLPYIDTVDDEVELPQCIQGVENTEASCSDGCSNDEDMYVDCDDFDCECALYCGGTGCGGECMSGEENTEAACSDGCSNDGDNFADCLDYDCDCATFCGGAGCIGDCVLGEENTEAACSDGCSNDGDNYVDCDDYDCDCATSCGGAGC